ncbi:MAG: M20/M25/M40 family metallo-hydrolase, partial [Gemmatimonadetes bacterium]|nr:M20/M25/M40 family metallo-hydrolase [Gemmatimonadota bacterium]
MKIDWNLMEKEAVERLRSMVRFDTTNPPGNELPLVRQLAEELEGEGLEPQVLESVEGRGNLAVRLKGDGSERPLLLLSHLDVVPVEPERWTHPPFAGEVADGFVWGRGAIDSKLTGAVELQVLLMCRRLGLPLKRDLVVVAAGDEEFGGKYGVGWLVEEHPELFDAEFGINEGGGFALLVDGKPLYVCQVGEKGSAPVDLVAKGRPGHSSVPHGENPIPLLGEALVALGARKMPHRVTESVRAFFEGAAAVQT